MNPYAYLDSVLDGIEKDYSMSNTVLDKYEKRTSTGLLCLDIVLGGGILGGGAYTVLGLEQSAKSTLANTIMSNMMNTNIPVVSYIDAEGSTSPDYLEAILQNFSSNEELTVEDLFGLKDSKTGKWIKPAKVRYYAISELEKVYDYIARLQRNLPDKVRIGDDFYIVYENTKVNQKLVGSVYDKEYFRTTGKLRVPVDNFDMQALILIDSYPALLPAKMDTEELSSAMAIQARAYSEQTKRVRGRMRSKRMTIIGVNQMRLKPGVVYGPSTYEPAGESLKHFSDVRLQLTSRALSGVPTNPKGKGQIEEEQSVTIEGATDQYRYIHVRAIKNKLSTPYLETWLRLWITDGQRARGFDLVWDTFYYGTLTGQIIGKREKILFRLIQETGELRESSKPMKWLEFKTMILGEKPDIAAVCKKVGLKPVLLRKFFANQIATGFGIKLFFDNKLDIEKDVSVSDVDGVDDDDSIPEHDYDDGYSEDNTHAVHEV